jgi:hypothetical protein
MALPDSELLDADRPWFAVDPESLVLVCECRCCWWECPALALPSVAARTAIVNIIIVRACIS